ncbi:MAG TPA: branched-chain amino acid aminotransferase [Bacteroidetes bacterium]|nr:branched-chain amino acid aminotransferase [Bacteroidota bacterium]
MSLEIKVTKTPKSHLESFDFNKMPPFGYAFTDHMFVADYIDGKWQNLEIKPLENLSLHPANLTLHYGQTIFEGMKAFLTNDNKAILFRPEMHAKRFNRSARRMSMPELPEDLFLKAVKELVKLEKGWIPDKVGSALYIRPLMIAMDDVIGVKPSTTYKFIILTLPSGPYYDRPLSLKAETKYVRAVKGGIGEAKTAGNYGASLYPFKLAKEEGYDQIMWLDGIHRKYVQEIGTMNIFFVIGDKLITPMLDGAVLAGITRDSILKLAKDKGIEVEERLIDVNELGEAYDKGELKEIFGSGTAAIVANINKLAVGDEIMTFDVDNYEIAPMISETINKMRKGEIPDKYGWIVSLD